MFGSAPDVPLGVRSIPAQEYVREYSGVYSERTGDVRNWAYYLHDTDGRHPVIPLADFLELSHNS